MCMARAYFKTVTLKVCLTKTALDYNYIVLVLYIYILPSYSMLYLFVIDLSNILTVVMAVLNRYHALLIGVFCSMACLNGVHIAIG